MIWAALWFYAAAGFISAVFWVDWSRHYFTRRLPLPAHPADVNASRVIGTVGMFAVAFVAWPVFAWLRFRTEQPSA